MQFALLGLSAPVQRSDTPEINQRSGENEYENRYLYESWPAGFTNHYRPSEQENDFKVEDDEQNCGEIKMYGNFEMGAAHRNDAGLEWQVFTGLTGALPQEIGQTQHGEYQEQHTGRIEQKRPGRV